MTVPVALFRISYNHGTSVRTHNRHNHTKNHTQNHTINSQQHPHTCHAHRGNPPRPPAPPNMPPTAQDGGDDNGNVVPKDWISLIQTLPLTINMPWDGVIKLALAIAGLLLAGGAAYTWILIDRIVQQMQRLERELHSLHTTVQSMSQTIDGRVGALHIDLRRELGSIRNIRDEMQVLSHNVDAYVGTDIPRMVRKIHKEARIVSAGGIALAVYGMYKLRATKPLQQLAHVLSINRRDSASQ